MRRRACLRIHLCAHAISRAIACDGDDEDDKTQTEKKLEGKTKTKETDSSLFTKRGPPLSSYRGWRSPGNTHGRGGGGGKKEFPAPIGKKMETFQRPPPQGENSGDKGREERKKSRPKCNFCSWYFVAFYSRMVVHFPRRRMKPFSNEAFSIFASEASKGRKWRLKCTKFSILPKGSIYRQHLINRTPPPQQCPPPSTSLERPHSPPPPPPFTAPPGHSYPPPPPPPPHETSAVEPNEGEARFGYRVSPYFHSCLKQKAADSIVEPFRCGPVGENCK